MARWHRNDSSGEDTDSVFSDLVASLHSEHRRRREQAVHTPAGELIFETEAFLTGRLAESLAAAGATVPVWAWLNLLAHGDARDLLRAHGNTERSGPYGAWWRARGRLARLVLTLATDNDELRRLQAEVLAPLELDLATVPEVERFSPASLLFIVEDALGLRPPPAGT